MEADQLELSKTDILGAVRSLPREIPFDLPAGIPRVDKEALERMLGIYIAGRDKGLSAREALEVGSGVSSNGNDPKDPGSSSLEGFLAQVGRHPERTGAYISGLHRRLSDMGRAPRPVTVEGVLYERPGRVGRPVIVGLDDQVSIVTEAVRSLFYYDPATATNTHVKALDAAILLYGPPGTGKSSLCKYAIAEGQCMAELRHTPFRYETFTSSDYSKWVGQSARNFHKKFRRVTRRDGIGLLFLDDADMVVTSREDDSASAGMNQVTAQLMQDLSGIKDTYRGNVLVVATTNRQFKLDSAVHRRFGTILEVPPYSKREQYVAFMDSRFPDQDPDVRDFLVQTCFDRRYTPAIMDHVCKAVERERWGPPDLDELALPPEQRRQVPDPLTYAHARTALERTASRRS